MNKITSVVALVAAILISQLAGAIGGMFTASSVSTWYAELEKPGFTPPGWIFGPVWTALFTLMGIAAWLVWRTGTDRGQVRTALWLFGAQLVLNTLWSFIFFGMRMPLLAWIELMVLWAAILATTAQFFRMSVAAGSLMIPYLFWVTFAGVLNFHIWRLNS